MITSLEDALALIGRTFESDDGERVTFVGIKCMPTYTDMLIVDDSNEVWLCVEYWNNWLSSAKEVS
jgi:hypothetical protein